MILCRNRNPFTIIKNLRIHVWIWTIERHSHMQHYPLALNLWPNYINMYLAPCSYSHASCVVDRIFKLPSSTLNTFTTTWTQTFHGCLSSFLFLHLEHLWFMPTSLVDSNTIFEPAIKFTNTWGRCLIINHMLWTTCLLHIAPNIYSHHHGSHVMWLFSLD